MDYQPNSNKSKDNPNATEKRLEKIVTGGVIQKRQPVGRKFRDVFFGGDFHDAARYVAADVLLPALRDLLVDSAVNAVKRVVYGDRYAQRKSPYEYRPRISYNTPVYRGPSQQQRVYLPDQPPHPPPARRYLRDSNQIILASRADAENVVERLIDVVNQYDAASLADLYDLLGLPSSPHTDNKWGWTYLNNVEIRQVREGCLIDLPPAEAL